jgi:hypothetical protein
LFGSSTGTYHLHVTALRSKRNAPVTRPLLLLPFFYGHVCHVGSLAPIQCSIRVNAVTLQHRATAAVKRRDVARTQRQDLLTAAPCIACDWQFLFFSFCRSSVVAVARDSCCVREGRLLNAGCESSDALGRFLTAVVKPRTVRGGSWVSASLMLLHGAADCRYTEFVRRAVAACRGGARG